MFNKKPKKSPVELGAEVVAAIKHLVSEFHSVRVAPLQSALADLFMENLDASIASHGIDADVIRSNFVDMERAWVSGLLEMKPELLGFRNMQECLECGEAVGARGELLDWMDSQFDEFTNELRSLATMAVGGRVLIYQLGTNV